MKVNHNVNYEFLVMMYQCQIISCNKCTTLVGNADNRRGYISVGTGEKWKVSVPINFAVNLKLFL